MKSQRIEYDIDTIKGPLKNTREINFKPEQTVFVMQQEYAVTDEKSDQPILTTGGAGSCIILALYDQKNKIAILAHIDNSCTHSVASLLKDISIEHTVAHLAGSDIEKDCLKVIEILEKNKIKIINADIVNDPTISEPASLAIDARTGDIYSPVKASHYKMPVDFYIRFAKIN